MTKNYYAKTASTEPTLFITKGRQRVKQYDGNLVYLKNGEEFELELFNPKSQKVLAKIKLNGTYLGSCIVLRPGERVFLERYLDEARKFKFETYEIDSNDLRARDAIANNGSVEVEFYNEYKYSSTYTITYNWPQPEYHYHYHYDANRSNPIPTWSYTTGVNGIRIDSVTSSSSSISNSGYYCASDVNGQASRTAIPEPIETGRVEKGNFSEQTLNSDYTAFEAWYSSRISWKILPESNRPYVREDLIVYCINCGAKRKKQSHKFCPNCGTRF